MPDLTYREHRAAGAKGGAQTIHRLFRLAGMEAIREGQVRLHLTAIGSDGMVDRSIDRAYVIVTEDALERILEAFEGLRAGESPPDAPRSGSNGDAPGSRRGGRAQASGPEDE
jgi:hypothetical protein